MRLGRITDLVDFVLVHCPDRLLDRIYPCQFFGHVLHEIAFRQAIPLDPVDMHSKGRTLLVDGRTLRLMPDGSLTLDRADA